MIYANQTFLRASVRSKHEVDFSENANVKPPWGISDTPLGALSPFCFIELFSK